VESKASARGMDYARPPIVEAVIERRFVNPIEYKVVDELRRKFQGRYPAVTQTAEFAFALNPDGAAPEVRQHLVGFRMVSPDGTAIVIITTHAVAFSRLAPYPGWAKFSAGASATFRAARVVTGYVPLTRIGVRYINRLDLPIGEGDLPVTKLEDYILVRPEYPEALAPATRGFTLQCVFDVQAPDCTGTITVAPVPSPVPRHISVVFDIDIGRNGNVPSNERDINKLMGSIRNEKNRIFDICLTDRMKELFR